MIYSGSAHPFRSTPILAVGDSFIRTSMDHLLPSRCSRQCTSTSQVLKLGAYTGLSLLPFASRRRAPQPLRLHIGTVRAGRCYPQVSCAAKHNAKQGGAGASPTVTAAKEKAGGGSAAAKEGVGAKKKARVYRRKAQLRRGRPVVKEVPTAAGDDPARSKDASFQLDRINPVSIGRKSRLRVFPFGSNLEDDPVCQHWTAC